MIMAHSILQPRAAPTSVLNRSPGSPIIFPLSKRACLPQLAAAGVRAAVAAAVTASIGRSRCRIPRF